MSCSKMHQFSKDSWLEDCGSHVVFKTPDPRFSHVVRNGPDVVFKYKNKSWRWREKGFVLDVNNQQFDIDEGIIIQKMEIFNG